MGDYSDVGVLRNVVRVPQPQPVRSEGGDCFACALIAVLNHLFPEREATFEDTDRWFAGQWAEPVGLMRKVIFDLADSGPSLEVLDRVRETATKLREQENAPPVSNNWRGMDKALWAARSNGWEVEVAYDMVIPQFDPREWGYGWPMIWAGDTYAQRLEAWLAAGWIALTVCDLDGRGPIIDGKLNSTNHFLVLDGARTYWKSREDGGASQVSEVHVVDSSTRDITGWLNARDWERMYGGTPWMLVRRDNREIE